MAELASFSEDSYSWNISFIHPVQDQELELVTSFMDLIYSVALGRNGADKLCWKLSPWGCSKLDLLTEL